MVSPESLGFSAERLQRIGSIVSRHIGPDKLAGAVCLVARRGELAYLDCQGLADREQGRPMRPDTLFRIYSMTKPITAVALMTLFEQGRVHLVDPVFRYLPAFRDLKVYSEQAGSEGRTVELQRPVTVWHLLTHRSGLTYSYTEYGRVEAMYRDAQINSPMPLEQFVAELARLPLAYQPGETFRYSCAYDVLAHLVERISGESFDVYLKRTLFEPLGMVDTGFFVPEEKLERLAAMYGVGDLRAPQATISALLAGAAKGINRRLAGPESAKTAPAQEDCRGGHGLISTASDYWRFCQMMLNGGDLDGVRILGRKTVELMTTNHLPPALLPYEIGGAYSPGYGYGLGVGVLMDVAQGGMPGSPGLFRWGGSAQTSFWVDPHEQLIGIQMAQFQPAGLHRIGPDFEAAVYAALL